MAVITQYVVVRNGEEKMKFTTKAEADAYDKMLDMVDELVPLLEQSEMLENEQACEDLAFYLAKQREPLLIALGAKKPAKKKTAKKVVETESAA
ncbi:damage-inducible protein [Aliidiomarina halalkaliphila]|uniref:Damage-inducible protein n=1 Tax=Aliidiomarina halalkaliphila TaxID=2593535 RepID=A0A552X4F0_9GAMM|nr:YebG family protein [Aliidiomarina halalkaliphila]TRW49900.1 damage-inducible protein [Aliidiomarina halalkaliphila]